MLVCRKHYAAVCLTVSCYSWLDSSAKKLIFQGRILIWLCHRECYWNFAFLPCLAFPLLILFRYMGLQFDLSNWLAMDLLLKNLFRIYFSSQTFSMNSPCSQTCSWHQRNYQFSEVPNLLIYRECVFHSQFAHLPEEQYLRLWIFLAPCFRIFSRHYHLDHMI